MLHGQTMTARRSAVDCLLTCVMDTTSKNRKFRRTWRTLYHPSARLCGRDRSVTDIVSCLPSYIYILLFFSLAKFAFFARGHGRRVGYTLRCIKLLSRDIIACRILTYRTYDVLFTWR